VSKKLCKHYQLELCTLCVIEFVMSITVRNPQSSNMGYEVCN